MLDPPWLPTVIYPARGIARLWQNPQVPPRALSRLIGPTRAVILEALVEPASTTGLAARCQLPLSTVSEHLAVLREAGMVTTTRTGRHLPHRRPPLGRELVNPHNAIESEASTNPRQRPQAP